MAEEDGTGKISKYNSGVAIILRLDELWKDTHRHSRAGFFSKWNADLDRVWCELARDLKPTDFDDHEKDGKKVEGAKTKFEKLDKELADCGAMEDSLGEGLDKPTKEQLENRKKQYKVLMEKDLFLRRLENKLGKGTAWDDDSDGFD